MASHALSKARRLTAGLLLAAGAATGGVAYGLEHSSQSSVEATSATTSTSTGTDSAAAASTGTDSTVTTSGTDTSSSTVTNDSFAPVSPFGSGQQQPSTSTRAS